MVTESPIKMLPGVGMGGTLGDSLRGNSPGMQELSYNEDLGKELGNMLREQRRYEMNERERELNLYRSGSAPPTVEGSLAAVGGFFNHNSVPGSIPFENCKSNTTTNNNGSMSEEELRSDPAYLSYYYSHVNLNPRLPPPILSKEDWRFAQRLQAGTSSHGGIGDRRKLRSFEDGNSKSLFSLQPVLPTHKEENEPLEKLSHGNLARQSSAEWFEQGADGLIGLSSGGGLGARRKSLADIFQEDLGRSSPIPRHPSRPASRNAFDDGVDPIGPTEAQVAHMRHEMAAVEGLRPGLAMPGLARVQSLGSQSSHAFASALGAGLSRSQTPDPQLVVTRSPSPCLAAVGGRFGVTEKQKIVCPNSFNGVSSSVTESAELASAMSGISLSSNCVAEGEKHVQSQLQQEISEHQKYLFQLQSGQNQNQQHSHRGKSEVETAQTPVLTQALQQSLTDLNQSNRGLTNPSISSVTSQAQVEGIQSTQKSGSLTPNFYSRVAVSAGVSEEGPGANYQNASAPNVCIPNYGMSGYPINPMLPSMMAGYLTPSSLPPTFDHAPTAGMDSRTAACGLPGGGTSGGNADLHSLFRLGGQLGTGLQIPVMDPLYVQYLQRTAEYAAQMSASLSDPSMARNYMGGSYVDLVEFQKAYLGALFAQQKSQYGMPFLGKGGTLNPTFYGNPSYGVAMPYPGSPIASPVLPSSPVAPASPPLRQNERSPRFPPGARSSAGGFVGSWKSENGGNMEQTYGSSLLEEFKNSKTRCFELAEIARHVVEFSADQYGSRFIQQKLETASVEEKNMVFQEIFPQALTLMTDVFGNYVIQKFFEHGTANQRKDLAKQLSGHILALSFQMYGCRVIQKAIEVVDAEQQAQMVLELDGHVMRCVRDQNGNHVIQKCIECIPQEGIQFIISSFFGQVVSLSTHPYGCRVIQRVLEHCTDAQTQIIMMEEILQSVCTLAQDQYGNYVVQHVLEHGKPHERAAVIKKLAGQIVQMSQQKFASNVVEKCLVFGGPAERQILISEMLGSTDENEPLQAMMKDQFANYVVQKVLETCDDHQRELILSRIKEHLNALKKYTYGKHIVARVEKLVAAGERRIGSQSTYLS